MALEYLPQLIAGDDVFHSAQFFKKAPPCPAIHL
jgi:hypothetical protein